jgi:hypothetical protein
MSFAVYLLKASLALALCWILYRAAFRKLSFFQWNRFYLLASVVLSLMLPLLRLQWGKAMVAVADFGGIDWTYVDHFGTAPASLSEQAGSGSPLSIFLLVYLTVALVLLLRSALRFRQLGLSTRNARRIRKGRVQVFVQDRHKGSFTVFRRIYLDQHAFEHRLRPVLRHEMVHAVQLHSLDLLLMEFVVAMLWFNPFVYVQLRAIRENHEYLADRYAQSKQDSLREYLECLKAETIRYFSPVPANYFKSSTIKKRIIMLTNNKSNQRKLWRYLGVLPLTALMLALFQSPVKPVLAGTSSSPEVFFIPAVPYYSMDGIPSLFPLPEKYKDKVTWGYEEEAIHPISRKKTTHLGIDVAAPTGTPVYAAADGVIQKAQEEKGWGKLVIIEHADGYTSFYAHLSKMEVESGTKVQKGGVIGRVGNTGQSTGPHLHYEVRKNGKQLDPADFF